MFILHTIKTNKDVTLECVVTVLQTYCNIANFSLVELIVYS